jgi:hypothetical protein
MNNGFINELSFVNTCGGVCQLFQDFARELDGMASCCQHVKSPFRLDNGYRWLVRDLHCGGRWWRRRRRISSSVFPQNIEPVITSIEPV